VAEEEDAEEEEEEEEEQEEEEEAAAATSPYYLSLVFTHVTLNLFHPPRPRESSSTSPDPDADLYKIDAVRPSYAKMHESVRIYRRSIFTLLSLVKRSSACLLSYTRSIFSLTSMCCP